MRMKPYLHSLKEYIRGLCLSNVDINNVLLLKRGRGFFAPSSWALILSLKNGACLNSSKTKTSTLRKYLNTVMTIFFLKTGKKKKLNLQYPGSVSQKFDR